MWAELRDWLRRNGAIDASTDLETDLVGPDFWHDAQDKIVLEPKEDMKARGLDSPDDADALALTFAAEIKAPQPDDDEEEFEHEIGPGSGGGEFSWMG